MITLTAISKSVKDGRLDLLVLDAITMTVEKGDFVAIIGPSGSGKSTLLNVLGLLDRPTKGDYEFAGERVSSMGKGRLASFRNQRIGFVFQSFMLMPRMSVAENVELPLLYTSLGRRERRSRVEHALQSVGMLEKRAQKAILLSGGEKQRVAIARSLVNEPDLILADEPTGNLDEVTKEGILQIFSSLQQQGRTIMMVTHDLEAARIANRCYRIASGRLTPFEFAEEE